MDIKKIMVVGSGFMGAGIAQVALQAGFDVVMHDVALELAQRGAAAIQGNLNRLVSKGKLDEDRKKNLLARLAISSSLDDADGTDLVIEAAFENFDVKKGILEKLDTVCRSDVVFATNTSSLSITKLAATTQRPDKCVGMHFFSPVPVMELVEIVSGLKTSTETVETIAEIVTRMGKEGVRVKDVPGFLVNRINNALRNEAYNCMMEGVASIEDIDKALKLALRHPMGPFELADFVGLDVGLAVARTLYDGYRDVKWRPNLTLEKLVLSGDLGRKTGKGWYDYTSGEKKPRTDVTF